jgi:subtilisin family serine protease
MMPAVIFHVIQMMKDRNKYRHFWLWFFLNIFFFFSNFIKNIQFPKLNQKPAMKFKSTPVMKFPGIIVGILILALSYGCQKNILDTGNDDYLTTSGSKSLINVRINNYMVISKSETLPSDLADQLSAYGKVIRSIPEIGVLVMEPKTPKFESKVSALGEVQAVVPDLMAKWLDPVRSVNEVNPPSIGSNETYFRYQWGMDAINAPEAWNAGFTGKKAKVFVLDSGIDAEHPDLAPNLNTSLSTSFVPDEDYNVDDGFYFSHGTHVSGIIAAADNSYGVIGVAPEAEIVMVKVLSEYTGSGAFSWINAGIVYAADNGADVINMSLGATFYRNGFYLDENDEVQKIPAVYMQNLILAQQRAVNYAFRKGALIITSAGNDGINLDGAGSLFKIPASLNNVIAVSATAPDYWYNSQLNGIPDPDLDIPASYTNYGKSLVDLAAPGGDFDFYDQINYHWDMVLSTISGGWGWAAGTSMSSPHVAGVAALIISSNEEKMSPLEVTKKLCNTADKLDGNGISSYYGNGRVNAFRAVTE